jgi:hypothetical protein
MATISYGDFTVARGKFVHAQYPKGMLRRSAAARRVCRTKLKQEIAELRELIDFLHKCDKLIDKERIL